jgi:hypothetical protein
LQRVDLRERPFAGEPRPLPAREVCTIVTDLLRTENIQTVSGD